MVRRQPPRLAPQLLDGSGHRLQHGKEDRKQLRLGGDAAQDLGDLEWIVFGGTASRIARWAC